MKIARDEIQPSREQGFGTIWSVARAYKIQDGVLIRGKGELSPYAPILYRELPSEISKLQQGDETGLLNFVNSYGELGYRFFKNCPNKDFGGDPISWIFAHAQTIRLCLELINALKNMNEQLINDVLRSKEYQGESPEWIKYALGPTEDEQIELVHESLINQAEGFLSHIINNNIKSIHRKLVFENDVPQARFTFSALVEVAYWQLLDTYVGGCLKRCEACGALFLQTDPRQQFCPKGRRKVSLCASRERLRRFRADRKGEKGSKAKLSKTDKDKGGEKHVTKRREG